jgi:hypothetical protein
MKINDIQIAVSAFHDSVQGIVIQYTYEKDISLLKHMLLECMEPPEATHAGGKTWAYPDGKRIVFVRADEPLTGLYGMNVIFVERQSGEFEYERSILDFQTMWEILWQYCGVCEADVMH